MSVAARVSMILAVQEHTSGPFPAVRTYPAAFERRLQGAGVKVYAASGTVESGSGGTTLDVPGTLTKVHVWCIQNLADPDDTGAADVVVSGGPVNGTVPRGQMVFATHDVTGWTAASVTITGTAGTPFKVIALGE